MKNCPKEIERHTRRRRVRKENKGKSEQRKKGVKHILKVMSK